MTASRFKKSSGSAAEPKRFAIAQLEETDGADGAFFLKGQWGDVQLIMEESDDPPDPKFENCKGVWDLYTVKGDVRFRLTQLWQSESKAGNTYFSGFLSKSRLVLLADHESGEDGTIWDLYLEEGKKEAEGQELKQAEAAEQARIASLPPAKRAALAQELDDSVPF
jgi:hypothetical protein